MVMMERFGNPATPKDPVHEEHAIYRRRPCNPAIGCW